MRILAQVTAIAVLFFGLGLTGSAQQTTATIVGNVTDISGASIGGATVTVVNTGTNASRTTTSESDGKYSLPSLTPGTYALSVEKSGFKLEKVTGIVLRRQSDRATGFHAGHWWCD